MMYTAGVGMPIPSSTRNTAESSSVGISSPPESVLMSSVNLPASALISIAPITAPAAATPDTSAPASQLQAAIALTVFQLAGSPAAQAPATGVSATGGTQVR